MKQEKQNLHILLQRNLFGSVLRRSTADGPLMSLELVEVLLEEQAIPAEDSDEHEMNNLLDAIIDNDLI